MKCRNNCGKEAIYLKIRECRSCWRKRRNEEIAEEYGECKNHCGNSVRYIAEQECDTCFRRRRSQSFKKEPCAFDGCINYRKYGSQYCGGHLTQKNTTGKLKPIRYAKNPGHNDKGYRILYRPEHPNSRSNGVIYEHTLVMSEYLGRPLEKHESVHHKNGQRADNRIENLELFSTKQPYGQRALDKVRYAIEILRLYPKELEELGYKQVEDVIEDLLDDSIDDVLD